MSGIDARSDGITAMSFMTTAMSVTGAMSGIDMISGWTAISAGKVMSDKNAMSGNSAMSDAVAMSGNSMRSEGMVMSETATMSGGGISHPPFMHFFPCARQFMQPAPQCMSWLMETQTSGWPSITLGQTCSPF